MVMKTNKQIQFKQDVMFHACRFDLKYKKYKCFNN